MGNADEEDQGLKCVIDLELPEVGISLDEQLRDVHEANCSCSKAMEWANGNPWSFVDASDVFTVEPHLSEHNIRQYNYYPAVVKFFQIYAKSFFQPHFYLIILPH